MLDITGNDIKDLNDSDLRSLIGLLCEAELSYNNLPTAGVTWGGHQDATDGGIDVRVDIINTPHPDSFIPRAKTGFQVKKPDMPRSTIINEMMPNGILRDVIKELVDSKGAYIIVSSQGSTTDSALISRVDAMREALKTLPNASNIKVDFYDRERIAGWVRAHPTIGLWIRKKLGRPIQGWKPYDNWAKSPDGLESEYFFDDNIRFYYNSSSNSDGMSGVVGIEAIRKSLHKPASSIRLTGLSGVGKTRLLQALFDERIGTNPLSKSLVFYTDIGNNPQPDPRNFAERLITLRKRAILAIDNCPPDLHRHLTSACTSAGSLVSLITVEYDVREDQPEETKVFRLEPASINLIEKVILERFKYINNIDAHTISEFSGGNARIAIALAKTIRENENLSNFKDHELFERLFRQRNEPDKELLKAAEILSLVYSFECDTDNDTNSELHLLASLADVNVKDLYRYISELKRRDLIQQRSKWRAILPHAIANKLAQRALENIPHSIILKAFEKNGYERILKSFSRRLSYLHKSEQAKDIARKWFSDTGLLSSINNLNNLGISLLTNIAPIEPIATINAIEKAARTDTTYKFLTRENPSHLEITRLLRSLAYDKELFSRSVELLCKFALSEDLKENNNSIRSTLKSLFYIYLSGTHASPEERLIIISNLMKSGKEDEIELGVDLLDATFESWHFSSSYEFEFGAHSRDHGYHPKDTNDIKHWYKLFIDFSIDFLLSNPTHASKVKDILSNNFRGLWLRASVFDELENATNNIIKHGSWNDGWVAIKSTLRFDSKKMDSELVSRLNKLSEITNPTTLIERARLYALSNNNRPIDLVDAIDGESTVDSYHRVFDITRSLGEEVSKDRSVLNLIVDDLLSSNAPRLYNFGQGLADGCSEPAKLWDTLKNITSSNKVQNSNHRLIQGFLNSISEKLPKTANMILDDALKDTFLSSIFPLLQLSTLIDNPAIERLKYSIRNNLAPIWQYNNLAYGRTHDTIPDKEFSIILKLISSKENGSSVAVNVLNMRLHTNKNEELTVSNTIKKLSQTLLLDYVFSKENYRSNNNDYDIAHIISSCFTDKSSIQTAKQLCKKMAENFTNNTLYEMDFNLTLNAISSRHPSAFLNGFIGSAAKNNYTIDASLYRRDNNQINPLSNIDNDVIIDWCDEDPINRYPLTSAAIIPYESNRPDKRLIWSPLANSLILNSPDPILVLDKFKSSFRPMSWGGSRAKIMQDHVCLITDLKNHQNTLVSEWARIEEVQFKEEISSELEWESKRNSSEDETFE